MAEIFTRAGVHSKVQDSAPRGVAALRRVLASPVVIALAALVVRLYLLRQVPKLTWITSQDTLYFGFEVGQVARSILAGEGFSSPFHGVSGPTAWLGPVCPLLVAGIFKIFGVFTLQSLAAIWALNSLFSALTCLVVFYIAREIFDRNVAVWAAWIWALTPYFMAAVKLVWETNLAALLLALAVYLTLRLERSPRPRTWSWFGLTWGLIALTSAALLACLPVCVAWLWYRGRVPLRGLAVAALLLVMTVAPWLARNYRVFGKFVFVRSNFGEELFMGNGPGMDGLCRVWVHPVWNEVEMERYRQMGEVAYVDHKKRLALEFIRNNPGEFARHTLRRAVFFWAGTPDPKPFYTRFGARSRHALFFTSALMAFWGTLLAIRRRVPAAWLFAALFAVYPLVYYVTHPAPRYRFPLDPLLIVMVGCLLEWSRRSQPVWLRMPRRKAQRQAELAPSETIAD